MSPQEARALAMANELFQLLGELYDLPMHGPGSCVADAWGRMEDVIAMLEPELPAEGDPDVPPVRRLRLVHCTTGR